jgi:hypothetical protein
MGHGVHKVTYVCVTRGVVWKGVPKILRASKVN